MTRNGPGKSSFFVSLKKKKKKVEYLCLEGGDGGRKGVIDSFRFKENSIAAGTEKKGHELNGEANMSACSLCLGENREGKDRWVGNQCGGAFHSRKGVGADRKMGDRL